MGSSSSKTATSPAPEIHKGISTNRRCRDVIFIIIFAVFWAAMYVICASAVKNGDPKLLTVPRDYNGNFCGYPNNGSTTLYADQTARPFLYYIDPFDTLSANATFICITSCPTTLAAITDYTKAYCRYNSTATSLSNLQANVLLGTCSAYQYPSSPILGRCAPTAAIDLSLIGLAVSASNSTVNVASLINRGRDGSAQTLADLVTTWPLLLVCAGTAIVISFIWLFLARFVVGPFVWITLLAVNLLAIITSVLLYFYWNSRQVAYASGTTATGAINIAVRGFNFTTDLAFLDTTIQVTKADVDVSLGIFVTIAILSGILILVSIAMIRKIAMAIEIINEASHAFRDLPGIQFLPFFFSLAQIVLFTYFVIVLIYIVCPVGIPTIYVLNMQYSSVDTYYYMMWFHIAGYIWTYLTINGMAHLSVAGAVAEWYWNADKKARLVRPVMRSVYRAFRYSLGSVILGSLLITIVELIRIALYNLQKKVSKSQIPWLKYLVACAQCCVKCLEVVVKWINRNALVYIAITGKSFFTSAGAATSLLLRNAAKTIAVTYVADVTLLFTKLVVVGINTLCAYAFLVYGNYSFGNKIFYPTVTITLVAIESFAIASVFFANYQLAVDTIFLSVLEDLDKNDGTPERPYLMTNSLRAILQKKNKVSNSANHSEIKQF